MTRKLIIDREHDTLFCNWLGPRIPGGAVYDPKLCRTIGHVEFSENGVEILGVVVLNNWTSSACEGHFASNGSKDWCTHNCIFSLYDFVFDKAGKTRMNFHVSADNEPSIRFQNKVGHVLEGRLADYYGEGKDALLFGLTKKQWQASKWAKPEQEK